MNLSASSHSISRSVRHCESQQPGAQDGQDKSTGCSVYNWINDFFQQPNSLHEIWRRSLGTSQHFRYVVYGFWFRTSRICCQRGSQYTRAMNLWNMLMVIPSINNHISEKELQQIQEWAKENNLRGQRNHIPVLKSNGKEKTSSNNMPGHRARSANNCSWSHDQWPSVGKRSRYLHDYIMRPASLRAASTEDTWATAAIPERRLSSHDPTRFLCADPAWIGFCTCIMNGKWGSTPSLADAGSLDTSIEARRLKTCAEAEEPLFSRLINYPNHVLHRMHTKTCPQLFTPCM